MSLTRPQVEAIAHLARLEITEAQMPVYVDSLSRIIDFVEQLAAADTGGVEPMAHPLADQVQRLRPDAVSETDEMALVGVLSVMLLHDRFVASPRPAEALVPDRVVVGDQVLPRASAPAAA